MEPQIASQFPALGQVSEAIRVLSVTISAFAVGVFLTPTLIGFLKRLNFGKQIREDGSTPVFSSLHKKKEGTPTMGGIMIWGTVLGLAALLFLADLLSEGALHYINFISRSQTYLPLAALGIAAVLGLLDDLLGVLRIGPFGGGLKIKHKLVAYTVLGLLGAWWFHFILEKTSVIIPFSGPLELGWLYFIFFTLVIIATTFSANETDGLDGLLGGVSLFAFVSYTVICFTLGMYNLAVMTGAIVGCLLAFLWFNVHPARFFMGDTGSMALGMTLGVTAMLTNTVFLLPLFFAIPVIESVSVLIQLLSKKLFKKKIFLSTPIHHHFEAVGWPESQVTMRFWIISIIFSSLGLAIFFLDRIY